jgi:sec-independent protein translocase protein TatC
MVETKMSLVGHLTELRRRIIISVLAILVATAAAFFLSDALLTLLLLPSGGLHLNAFNLTDGFMIRWQLSLYAGIVVTFPIWAYQLYAFIRPGLQENERRTIFPAMFGSLVLFALGAVFGYYLLTSMIRVLIELLPQPVTFLPSAEDYISFVVFFLVACGLAFQLPTLLLILVSLRLLSSKIMRQQRRIAYFVLFVFAEIITPVSDPIVAPLTVMLPLVLLYELSVWLATRVEGRRRKNAARDLATANQARELQKG